MCVPNPLTKDGEGPPLCPRDLWRPRLGPVLTLAVYGHLATELEE